MLPCRLNGLSQPVVIHVCGHIIRPGLHVGHGVTHGYAEACSFDEFHIVHAVADGCAVLKCGMIVIENALRTLDLTFFPGDDISAPQIIAHV